MKGEQMSSQNSLVDLMKILGNNNYFVRIEYSFDIPNEFFVLIAHKSFCCENYLPANLQQKTINPIELLQEFIKAHNLNKNRYPLEMVRKSDAYTTQRWTDPEKFRKENPNFRESSACTVCDKYEESLMRELGFKTLEEYGIFKVNKE